MSSDVEVVASVVLAHLQESGGSRRVWAELRGDGHLVVQGQDLGGDAGTVSPRGEYEFAVSVSAADLPTVLGRLGAPMGADPIGHLRDHWSGRAASDLVSRLRAMPEPGFWSYS